MSKKTWLAFGCSHIPHHDKENAAWVIEQIKERQPDIIVCLGDLIECESVSSFPKVDVVRLEDEYRQTAEFLERIHDAAPKAGKVFMEGNHEERITRPDYAQLTGLLDYRKHIKTLKRWKYHPYILEPKYTFKIGQVVFAHGFSATLSGISERKEGVDLSGQISFTLYVHAHTHRPAFERVSLSTWRLPFWRCNVGCGIDFEWAKRGYVKKRNISQWGHALAYGWADTKRRADIKRNWEVELIERRKAWDC